MKLEKSFFKKISLTLIISFIIAAYPLYVYGSKEIIIAAVVGAFLSTLNVILGYIFIEIAFDKSMTKFLKTILGSMGIRLVLLLLAILAAIKLFKFHLIAFTTSLFIFYIIFLIFEIIFIDKKVRSKTS